MLILRELKGVPMRRDIVVVEFASAVLTSHCLETPSPQCQSTKIVRRRVLREFYISVN